MKTNWATWTKYLESFSEGAWYDAEVTINGIEEVDFEGEPDGCAVVKVSSGVIYQGDNTRHSVDLLANFSKWKKAQSESIIACAIPKEKEQEFLAMLGRLGGRKI